MLSTEKIKSFIRQPELISSEEIPHLLELTSIFPMSSTFKLLYLNGLKNSDDIRFNTELERLAAGISDRSQLYFLSKKSKDFVSAEQTFTNSSAPIIPLETVNESFSSVENLTTKAEEIPIESNEFVNEDSLQTEATETLNSENQTEEIISEEKNEFLATETIEEALQNESISEEIESKVEEPFVEEITETPTVDIQDETQELTEKSETEIEIEVAQENTEISNQFQPIIPENIEQANQTQGLIEEENEVAAENEGFSILLSLNEDKKESKIHSISENDDLSELYLAEASGQDYLSSLAYEEEVNEEIEAAISLVELVGDVEIEKEEVLEIESNFSFTETQNEPTEIQTEETHLEQKHEPLTISAKRSFTAWLKASSLPKSENDKEDLVEKETSFEEQKTEDNIATESFTELPIIQETQEEEIVKNEVVESNENESVIEFIPIERPKREFFNPIKKAKESLDEDKMPVSETLAKIFVLQKNYSKAIYVYEQLGLIFPKKKSFFVAQIENINKKIKE
jgi:hypothetical protein